MKLKQRLSALVIFTGLFVGITSCNKEKDQTPPVPVPVSTRLQEYKNGDDFIRFEYNTDGTIKKAILKSDMNTNGDVVDYNIAYNAQKKITSVITSAGERIVPVYENGSLSRADVFENNNRTGFTNYYYENAYLKKAIIYWGGNNAFLPFLEFDFTYNDSGNPSRTIVLMATNVPGLLKRVYHVDYQYDDKTNPLLDHSDLLALLWQPSSKNNIKQEDHFDADLHLEDRYLYTYTYKATGLPTHAEVRKGLPGQPATTSQVEFIYH